MSELRSPSFLVNEPYINTATTFSSSAPVNSLGDLRIMFRVDNIDELVSRLSRQGAQLADEIVNYEDVYRLCYIRRTEGLLIGLTEQHQDQTTGD